MDMNSVRFLRPRRTRQSESRTSLITCPLCLRVLRGSEWVDAESVIRDIRSYDLADPPLQESAVCDFCSESIFSRREHPDEPLAA